MGDPSTKLFIVKVQKDPELYYCVTVKTKEEILAAETPRFTMTYHQLAEAIGHTLTAFTGFPKTPKSPKFHPRKAMEIFYEFDECIYAQVFWLSARSGISYFLVCGVSASCLRGDVKDKLK